MAIFRSIDVGDDLQLTLGQPIPPEVMKDMEPDPKDPSKYTLKPGTFTRAEKITVYVDAAKLVQRMDFGYANDADYADLREDFIKELGQPDEGAAAIPDAKQQTVWADSQTRFALWAKGQGAQSKVGSTLTNLVATPA